MLSDETVAEMERAARACDAARDDLENALESAETEGGEEHLKTVASALEDWRDAQLQFMNAVEQSGTDDPSTAAMLLQMNHGVDTENARRGLPGAHVEGADQPFDVDMTGQRGSIITAATEYVSPPE